MLTLNSPFVEHIDMTSVVKSLASSQPAVAAAALHHRGTSLRHPSRGPLTSS